MNVFEAQLLPLSADPTRCICPTHVSFNVIKRSCMGEKAGTFPGTQAFSLAAEKVLLARCVWCGRFHYSVPSKKITTLISSKRTRRLFQTTWMCCFSLSLPRRNAHLPKPGKSDESHIFPLAQTVFCFPSRGEITIMKI